MLLVHAKPVWRVILVWRVECPTVLAFYSDHNSSNTKSERHSACSAHCQVTSSLNSSNTKSERHSACSAHCQAFLFNWLLKHKSAMSTSAQDSAKFARTADQYHTLRAQVIAEIKASPNGQRAYLSLSLPMVTQAAYAALPGQAARNAADQDDAVIMSALMKKVHTHDQVHFLQFSSNTLTAPHAQAPDWCHSMGRSSMDALHTRFGHATANSLATALDRLYECSLAQFAGDFDRFEQEFKRLMTAYTVAAIGLGTDTTNLDRQMAGRVVQMASRYDKSTYGAACSKLRLDPANSTTTVVLENLRIEYDEYKAVAHKAPVATALLVDARVRAQSDFLSELLSGLSPHEQVQVLATEVTTLRSQLTRKPGPGGRRGGDRGSNDNRPKLNASQQRIKDAALKAKHCVSFALHKACRFGDKCKWPHVAATSLLSLVDGPELGTLLVVSAAVQAPEALPHAPFSASGRCEFGDTCQWGHSAAGSPVEDGSFVETDGDELGVLLVTGTAQVYPRVPLSASAAPFEPAPVLAPSAPSPTSSSVSAPSAPQSSSMAAGPDGAASTSSSVSAPSAPQSSSMAAGPGGTASTSSPVFAPSALQVLTMAAGPVGAASHPVFAQSALRVSTMAAGPAGAAVLAHDEQKHDEGKREDTTSDDLLYYDGHRDDFVDASSTSVLSHDDETRSQRGGTDNGDADHGDGIPHNVQAMGADVYLAPLPGTSRGWGPRTRCLYALHALSGSHVIGTYDGAILSAEQFAADYVTPRKGKFLTTSCRFETSTSTRRSHVSRPPGLPGRLSAPALASGPTPSSLRRTALYI